MTRAHAAGRAQSQAEEDIDSAGEAMLLLITRSTWETLLRQGAAEGIGPGEVLNKALRSYLEQHGSEEVVRYLNKVAGGG
jgi:hypothetical protein